MDLPETFWPGFAGSAIYGILGIFLLLLGFKLYDLLLTKVDFQQELKGNPLATSITISAFFVSLAIIVAACIH